MGGGIALTWCVIEFAPPHTLTRRPGGHASPAGEHVRGSSPPIVNRRKWRRGAERRPKMVIIMVAKNQTKKNHRDSGGLDFKALWLPQRLSTAWPIFFPSSVFFCLPMNCVCSSAWRFGSFLHGCLKRCESFNDWIEKGDKDTAGDSAMQWLFLYSGGALKLSRSRGEKKTTTSGKKNKKDAIAAPSVLSTSR